MKMHKNLKTWGFVTLGGGEVGINVLKPKKHILEGIYPNK